MLALRAPHDSERDVEAAEDMPRARAGTEQTAAAKPISRSAAAVEPEPEDRPAEPEPAAAERAPPRVRRSTSSSEPRLERVVVRPDAIVIPEDDSKVSEAAEEAASTRRGWWQRR